MDEELHLETILTFGKHQGSSVEDLIYDKPDYMTWMVDNEFRFSDEAVKLMEDRKVI